MTTLTRSHFLAGSSAALTLSSTPDGGEAAAEDPGRPFYVLVLSGGGAYGAYEAGVLSRLHELGIAYDVVCGTSIGALNGALYASGQTARLVHLWHHLAATPILDLPRDLRPTAATSIAGRLLTVPHRLIQIAFGKVDGFYDAEPVRSLLREYLVMPDGKRIVPFTTPFFWAVTDLSDLCGNYYFHDADGGSVDAAAVSEAFREKGERLNTIAPQEPEAFVEALRASSAIPAAFQPAYADGRVLVDGGVVNNTPFDVAKIARRLLAPRRPLEIHAVFNAPRERKTLPADVRNGLAILFACYDVMQKRLVDDAARLTVREAALAAQMPASMLASDERLSDARDVAISVVRPASDLEGTVYSFTDQAAMDRNFERGARDAQKGWKRYVIPPEFCVLGPA